MTLAAIVPVFRGAHYLPELLGRLRAQSHPPDVVVVAETEPRGETERLVVAAGARYRPVDRPSFDHAGTRSELARESGAELLLFLSQDALPADDRAVERLVAPLRADPAVAAAFGRQVPPPGAHPFTRFKRGFLYPGESRSWRLADREAHGFRATFFSNAFAAWRREPLAAIGFFGERRLMCEDVAAAGRLLLAGHAVAYVADARAEHGNEHPMAVEWRRYFDIGATHAEDPWILETFGAPNGEGWRFVREGVAFLAREGEGGRLPAFALSAVGKKIAYTLGRNHRRLPPGMVRRLSSLPEWWVREPPAAD